MRPASFREKLYQYSKNDVFRLSSREARARSHDSGMTAVGADTTSQTLTTQNRKVQNNLHCDKLAVYKLSKPIVYTIGIREQLLILRCVHRCQLRTLNRRDRTADRGSTKKIGIGECMTRLVGDRRVRMAGLIAGVYAWQF